MQRLEVERRLCAEEFEALGQHLERARGAAVRAGELAAFASAQVDAWGCIGTSEKCMRAASGSNTALIALQASQA